jgi:hypothetical protein
MFRAPRQLRSTNSSAIAAIPEVHADASVAKLTSAMVLVTLLLLGLTLAFAPSGWDAECVIASIIVPGVIFWIAEKYGDRFG